MLSQQNKVNSNSSTILARPTDAADLDKAELPATVVDRREFLKGLGVLVCSTAASMVSAEPPKPTQQTLSEINGMPYSAKFYGDRGQEIGVGEYRGSISKGGALNVLVMATDKISPDRKLPEGMELRLRIYIGTDPMPSTNYPLPVVPTEVNGKTLERFMYSRAGKDAIAALQKEPVHIPIGSNHLPGNLTFIDRDVRSVRLELVKKP
jgi:hypothetical protein